MNLLWSRSITTTPTVEPPEVPDGEDRQRVRADADDVRQRLRILEAQAGIARRDRWRHHAP